MPPKQDNSLGNIIANAKQSEKIALIAEAISTFAGGLGILALIIALEEEQELELQQQQQENSANYKSMQKQLDSLSNEIKQLKRRLR